MVLVHDDSPRMNWRMAVIEELSVGGDGLVRAANIRTNSGKTNRPITKLYPLEINSPSEATHDESLQLKTVSDRPEISAVIDTSPTDGNQFTRGTNSTRPVRSSAQKARKRCAKWADTLLAPPEDVVNCENN